MIWAIKISNIFHIVAKTVVNMTVDFTHAIYIVVAQTGIQDCSGEYTIQATPFLKTVVYYHG